MRQAYFLSVDVEEWFNILDVPGEIPFEQWEKQEERLAPNLKRLLELFRKHKVKATFFWLGFFAERYPELVLECLADGHEIASHGYAHLLAFKVGKEKFREDIRKGKKILEDITGEPVLGFRAAGFSTTDDTKWTFEEVRAAGHLYDSSVFPANHGHGGMSTSPLEPFLIQTAAGDLLEIPQSVITVFGKRVSLFGGGYLRLAPWSLIRQGIRVLEKNNRPVIIYIHPREVDPEHPRLEMPLSRKFKSYVNLKSTWPKLEKLCRIYRFIPMKNMVTEQRNAETD